MIYLTSFFFLTTIYFFRRFRYYKKKSKNVDRDIYGNILFSNKNN